MEKTYRIIILPGWGGSQETWQDFIDILKKKYAVSVIDLPCFGATPCPDRVWGVDEYATYVRQQVEAYAGEHIILLGHSFGGQIAAFLAAKDPSICQQLILSAAAVYRPKNYLRRIILWCLAKMGKVIFRIPFIERLGVWAKHMLYRVADSPDYKHTSGIKRDIFKNVIRQDVSGALPNISQRTLVISGDHDSYVPLRFSKRIARRIPGGILAVIPGGTHGLHIHKKNQLFHRIDDFISSI